MTHIVMSATERKMMTTDEVGDIFLGICVGITYFIMCAFIWVPLLWALNKWWGVLF